MKAHTKIYMQFHGFEEGDYIPDIMNGRPSNDIHHISARGMGGSKCKDHIENLAALTRENHNRAEVDKEFNKQVRIQTLKNVIEMLETH